MSTLKRFPYQATTVYIIMIVSINVLFARLPIYQVLGNAVSPMDPVAGMIYLFRDFAQRELGHRIIIAMIIGSLISYFLASPELAFASISAFIAGELIDWLIFTFSKKPLSQRLIWSSTISAPVDSSIFLWGIDRFNLLAAVVMCITKVLGVAVIWWFWRQRQR